MIETIDNNVNKEMLSGIRSSYTLRAWWSPELHHAFLVKKYWILRITERITNVSMSKPLQSILNQLPPTSPLHPQKYGTTIRTHLRYATKELNTIRKND